MLVALEHVHAQIRNQKDSFESDMAGAQCACSAIRQIEHLFVGRVGDHLPEEDLARLCPEGSWFRSCSHMLRSCDAELEEAYRNRNLVLWAEILRIGERSRKPMVLVSEEGSDSWWMMSHGRSVGARPELIEEYYGVAGERVHFCEVSDLLSMG